MIRFRIYVAVALIQLVALSACAGQAAQAQPTSAATFIALPSVIPTLTLEPTNAPAPTITTTPFVSATPEPTSTAEPTFTPTPEPTATVVTASGIVQSVEYAEDSQWVSPNGTLSVQFSQAYLGGGGIKRVQIAPEYQLILDTAFDIVMNYAFGNAGEQRLDDNGNPIEVTLQFRTKPNGVVSIYQQIKGPITALSINVMTIGEFNEALEMFREGQGEFVEWANYTQAGDRITSTIFFFDDQGRLNLITKGADYVLSGSRFLATDTWIEGQDAMRIVQNTIATAGATLRDLLKVGGRMPAINEAYINFGCNESNDFCRDGSTGLIQIEK